MTTLLSSELDRLISTLPDPAAARSFVFHLAELHPHGAEKWLSNDALMSNVLVLVSYSPLLAQTMLQQPDHLNWLARERNLQTVKPKDRLREQLARFAARHSSLPEQVAMARFKRRELLRIYLRDCLGSAALSETTAELSNLADVLLDRTLSRCTQSLVKEAGTPSTLDDRGRTVPAEFAIIALGKLGSLELNYSSDIDLLFLYSVDGETQPVPGGSQPSLTNKQFFTRLAERIVGVIGKVAGEGAIYRIDLRLRPRGRMGDLVMNLKNAVSYYRGEAQNWERQSLIKARCSAGSERLVNRFLSELAGTIYPVEGWQEVLRDVRQSKEKIGRQQIVRGDEDNVKLGRGGIREIEFIVQALQLYYGGRDPWIRSPNTLIGLERLAERGYLKDIERTHLASAYHYLRKLEHRLQMEHGVQTHSLPPLPERLALVARRMGYEGSEEGVGRFTEDLRRHRDWVSQIFEQVFSRHDEQTGVEAEGEAVTAFSPSSTDLGPLFAGSPEEVSRLVSEIEQFLKTGGVDPTAFLSVLYSILSSSLNPLRALRSVRKFLASLATIHAIAEKHSPMSVAQFRAAVSLCARSGYFAELVTSHPRFIFDFPESASAAEIDIDEISAKVGTELRAELRNRSGFGLKMDAMRTVWRRELLRIGCVDVLGEWSLQEVNRAQTALARAIIEVATDVAVGELSKKHSFEVEHLKFCILGLGRMSHSGLDYGSDLDLLFVYDDQVRQWRGAATLQQFYCDLVEMFVRVLSTMTREGILYRVDLRLRPDGSKGLLASSLTRFVDYIQEQAQTWELLAYVKTRAAGGNAAFGCRAADAIIEACFDVSRGKKTQLAGDIIAIRKKLHREKVAPHSMNIKWGAGAMFDVYFATRFLQLTHAVRDPSEAGTLPLIEYLSRIGLLTADQSRILQDGYRFLRRIDHELRLYFSQRVYSLPSQDSQLAEVSANLGLSSGESLLRQYREKTLAIESVFNQIVRATPLGE